MEKQTAETEYKATLSQWEEFLKGSVWHDIQLFMAEKIDFQFGRLAMTFEERQTSEKYAESDDMIRGRLREASDFLNIPVEIAHELADREEQKKPE
jgi:hypothetical protein